MEKTDHLNTLQEPVPTDADDDPKVAITDGARTVQVDGLILQAQFRIDKDHLLVVLTDDCPFEERLNFHLLSSRLKIVDSLSVGAPYQSLLIQEVRVENDVTMTIVVNEGAEFRVQVNPTALSVLESVFAKASGKSVGRHGRLVLEGK